MDDPKPGDLRLLDESLLSRAQVHAQAALLGALIATHPDIAQLRREFARQSASRAALLQGAEISDAAIGALDFWLDKWTHDLEQVEAQRMARAGGTPPTR